MFLYFEIVDNFLVDLLQMGLDNFEGSVHILVSLCSLG